jgi:RNA polymerase sigma-70 factor (ECF subfamily)
MTSLSIPWDRLSGAATAAAPAPAPTAEARVTEQAANDDREVIVRAQAGDEEAFRDLVERYKKRAYWVAFNLVNDENEARDISQEAFIRVFRNIAKFDLRFKFYTWLYQIVTNLSIDALRKRQGQRRVSLEDVGDVRAVQQSAHERLERLELKERVAEVLETLPPKYKAVLSLRELEGLSSKEIATIVGSTHATVRWRLHRARSLFRDAWEARFGKELAPQGERVEGGPGSPRSEAERGSGAASLAADDADAEGIGDEEAEHDV